MATDADGHGGRRCGADILLLQYLHFRHPWRSKSEGSPVVGMIGVLDLPYPQGELTVYEGRNASAGVTWQRYFRKP